MTFDGCKFNVSGKAINVYRESGKFNVEVNYKDCSVVSTKDGKAVMNINDSLMGNSKFTINISGKNSVTGLTSDDLNKEYKKEQETINGGGKVKLEDAKNKPNHKKDCNC